MFSQESRGNPEQLRTWQRTTCRLEHPILGTTWGCDHQGPPSSSEPEGVCHGQTERLFLLMLNMCWNSCSSSSHGLEHSICSHRSVLLAWKLEGAQGEYQSKISNCSIPAPVDVQEKVSYLALGSQLFLTASPTGPSRSGSYRISGKLETTKLLFSLSCGSLLTVAALHFTCAS